jgi:rhomboid family GlyGly-CTERM serine protease
MVRHWALPLAVTVVTLVLQGADLTPALRLERTQVLAEPWRLVTGHLVHLGWTHLFMNLAGLAVIWVLLGPMITHRQWAVAMLACGVGVSAGLLAFSPQVAWYVGFSGILHGLLAAGALVSLRTLPGMGVVLLSMLGIKIALEQWANGDLSTAALIGGAVIVDAHLYGALVGLACGIFLLLRTRRNRA